METCRLNLPNVFLHFARADAPGVLIFFEALGRSILLAVQCSKYRVAIGQVHNAWLDHVPRLPVAGQPQKTQTLRLYVC